MKFGEKTVIGSRWLEYEDCFKRFTKVESSCIIGGSMLELPKVSIMIPTYRRAELLRESIESALRQDNSIPYEVVVVDNDQSPEVSSRVDALVRSFGSPILRLFRNQTNVGMFGNWNRCIELARGDWVSILNDDDLLKNNWLTSIFTQLKGRAMQATAVEVFGDYNWASSRKSFLGKALEALESFILMRGARYKVTASDIFLGNPVHASLGVLMNKEAALELGGYNEEYWPISDYVFNVRYSLALGAFVLREPLAMYRYSVNESLNPSTMIKSSAMTYELRRQLIALLWSDKLFSKVMAKLNEQQACIDAFNYHRISNETLDWREMLDELGIPHSNIAPSKIKQVLARLAWIIFCNFRKKSI